MERNPGTLTARDADVLDRMLRGWPPPTDAWLALLKRKLAAGRLAPGTPPPSGLAMIDARVAFRCASGLADTRTLCLPGAYAPGGILLPVTTIYGLALLGLREGETMRFDRPGGRPDWVALDRVLYQPANTGLGVPGSPPVARPALRVATGGRDHAAANENSPGPGPGPSVA